MRRRRNEYLSPGFKRKFLSRIGFALPLVVLLAAAGCGSSEEETKRARITPVVVAEVAEKPFERTVTVQGTLAPRYKAFVSPLISGTIEKMPVDEGDLVEAGKTVLFQIESLELERSRDIAEEALRVARLATREREANLARVQAEYDQAARDYERYKRLFEKDKAVSKTVFEQAETQFKRLSAMKTHAGALLDLAREEEKRAALSLTIAEKRLRDATVRSPLTGIVSARMREPGEFAKAGEAVFVVIDPKQLEVRAIFSSEYYPLVKPGETEAVIKAGNATRRVRVSYKSPSVDEKLRTFLIKIYLEADGENFIPGAMADVTLILEKRTARAVPRNAVLLRAEGNVVFVVRGERALKVPVETGLKGKDFLEVREGKLVPGDRVIVRGHSFLADGEKIRIVSGEDAQ